MGQFNEATLVTKRSFQAVGIRWEGTFAEAAAGDIQAVHAEVKNRLHEIKHVPDPELLLGLSHHLAEGRFTHDAVLEVSRVEEVPEGMIAVTIPELTYAMYEHKRGQNIDASYKNIYAWIKEQGLELHKGPVTHFEQYPMSNTLYMEEPAFTIMIPVQA
ncbi:GyrI-like domain-containing protein [Paenibacillus piri]|uniref:AraC family transcriptional regulator n=1 Tax=Paenibacillus piri TaxID=2547395 RepID=A0A4R5KGJ3_9BACL|nr:GyrI-like domain-containing protein [Paenibacillus piri]TDF94473.1 AraC family transcriptional regulator [Paenibacillus piri]